MRNATMNIALQHTGAFGVRQTREFNQVVPYSQSTDGVVDVAAGTAGGTAFSLALGTIGNVTGLTISNHVGQEVGVRFNSAISDQFHVADGATLTLALPAALTAGSITSIRIVTTATVAADGYVEYTALGTVTAASLAQYAYLASESAANVPTPTAGVSIYSTNGTIVSKGSDGVNRSLWRTFDVQAFGADPSGATPSDVAFAAAVTAKDAAHGGIIRIPTGTYLLNNTWNTGTYACVIKGDGYGCLTSDAHGTVVNSSVTAGSAIALSDTDVVNYGPNHKIQRLTIQSSLFDGSVHTAATGVAYRPSYTTLPYGGLELEDVWIKGFAVGLNPGNIESSQLKYVGITNCTTGMALLSGLLTNTNFYHLGISSCDVGILAEAGRNFNFWGGAIQSCTTAAIRFKPNRSMLGLNFNGMWFENNGTDGHFIYDLSYEDGTHSASVTFIKFLDCDIGCKYGNTLPSKPTVVRGITPNSSSSISFRIENCYAPQEIVWVPSVGVGCIVKDSLTCLDTGRTDIENLGADTTILGTNPNGGSTKPILHGVACKYGSGSAYLSAASNNDVVVAPGINRLLGVDLPELTITGLQYVSDQAEVQLFMQLTGSLRIAHNNSGSAAANRIWTPYGADVVIPQTNVGAGHFSIVKFVYSRFLGAWVLDVPQGVASAPQTWSLSSTQHNNVRVYGGSGLVYVTLAGAASITGVSNDIYDVTRGTNTGDGDVLDFYVTSAYELTIKNMHTDSVASNRIWCPSNADTVIATPSSGGFTHFALKRSNTLGRWMLHA